MMRQGAPGGERVLAVASRAGSEGRGGDAISGAGQESSFQGQALDSPDGYWWVLTSPTDEMFQRMRNEFQPIRWHFSSVGASFPTVITGCANSPQHAFTHGFLRQLDWHPTEFMPVAGGKALTD